MMKKKVIGILNMVVSIILIAMLPILITIILNVIGINISYGVVSFVCLLGCLGMMWHLDRLEKEVYKDFMAQLEKDNQVNQSVINQTVSTLQTQINVQHTRLNLLEHQMKSLNKKE